MWFTNEKNIQLSVLLHQAIKYYAPEFILYYNVWINLISWHICNLYVKVPDNTVVSIPACNAGDGGSVPCIIYFTILNSKWYLLNLGFKKVTQFSYVLAKIMKKIRMNHRKSGSKISQKWYCTIEKPLFKVIFVIIFILNISASIG